MKKNTTWFGLGKATLIYFYNLQIHRQYFLEISFFNFFSHEFYSYFIRRRYDIFMIIFKVQFTNDFGHISYDIHTVISLLQTLNDRTIGDMKRTMFNTLALCVEFLLPHHPRLNINEKIP